MRWGLASFWVMVPYLLWVAMMAFAWAAGGEPRPGATPRMLVALGISAIWAAACQAFAVVYYQRRIRELAQLEALKRSLDECA